MTTPVYGRRQAFLTLIGAIYVIVGSTNAIEPPAGNLEPYSFALLLAPMEFWGGLWALCGVAAIVFAYWPRRIERHDAWGFTILAAWTNSWAAMCFGSTIFLHSERGWIAGMVWGAFAGAVLIVSGMYGARGRAPTT